MKEIEDKQEIEKSQKVEKICTCLSGPSRDCSLRSQYNNQALRDNFWLTPPSVFCMTVQFSPLNIQIRPRGQRGELGENEKWWAERQKALEQAGYMLRPRYHSDRKFSWAGIDKSYLDFEDGQPQVVSVVIF
jgi:hypothetical protein